MKLVGRIICSILLSITILFSLVFAFIELRSLVAGDYSLMNNVTISFVTYLFRGLYFVILASFSIFLLGIYLKDKEVAFIYYFIGGCLLIGSIFSIAFYSTYVYFVIILIGLFPAATFVIRKLFLK